MIAVKLLVVIQGGVDGGVGVRRWGGEGFVERTFINCIREEVERK